MAQQQYIYSLGKRVFTTLFTYACTKMDKQQLYSNITHDFWSKKIAMIFHCLKDYADAKKERVVNDVILMKQI